MLAVFKFVGLALLTLLFIFLAALVLYAIVCLVVVGYKKIKQEVQGDDRHPDN